MKTTKKLIGINSRGSVIGGGLFRALGSTLFLATVAFAQTVAPPEEKTTANQVPSKPEETFVTTTGSQVSAKREETLVLSPFVVTGKERGYYGSNTMSGTRLNSSIEDLAASITVVTKQQMQDFAMLDINDIFLYEAGTEGSGTYTDAAANADGVLIDNTQLNPNNANRMRGISSANLSFGNFQTSGRVPVDPINVESVEINRGPNSTVFGLGNAGGTVNLQPASANLGKNRGQVSMRVDSMDGNRSSLDLNQVLKKDVLAFRAQAVYQHDGFERKPSGTDTTRLNGMVKYQPFKNTTISASYSYYHLQGNRPNTTTPLDGVTLWDQSGRPTWDPVTATVHLNGATLGPFTPTTLPNYFATTNSIRTYSTFAVDENGKVSLWMPMQATSSTTDPNASKQNVFSVITSPNVIRTTQPLFASNPVVSSKSVYDWSSINLAAPNYLQQTTNTIYASLEHIFFNTPRQLLALQAGFYREEDQKSENNVIGNAGSSGRIGYLNIDVNERLINGQANPFFMRPFMGISLPQSFDLPLRNQIERLQLAYTLDLRQEKSILRWLGLQKFAAYGEYKDNIARSIGYRDVIADDHTWLAAVPRASVNAASGGGNDIARNYVRYYVGDNGPQVDYAPRGYTPGTYNYIWGNGVTGVFKTESALLARGVASDRTGGSSNTRQVLKTAGVVLQSYWWRDRVVTTLGLRRDHNYNKFGVAPTFLADGTLDRVAWKQWAPVWAASSGTTKTAGVVVKPFPWLNLHANVSESFQPASAAVDISLQQLPDPTGKGKDYGFTLNLFEGKLLAKFNHYETEQNDARAGAAAAARIRAMDFDFVSSSTNRSNWLNAQVLNWVTADAAALGQTLTQDQADAKVASVLGFTLEEYRAQRAVPNSTISETADVLAKGTEVELFFNPSGFWTAKLNIVKQESINLHLSPVVQDWIAKRLPLWNQIIDPTTGQKWIDTIYPGATFTSAFFLQRDVLTPLAVDKALEGKSKPQVRKYKVNLSTSYRLAGITDHKIMKRFTVGGALRWEDKGAINFYGVETLPAIITSLDVNRPIWDKAHLYVDAFVSYRTKLFSDKINATFQLNGRNLQEGGRLQPTNAYPDGTPYTYRIIDPRQFILTATFDF